MIIIIGIDHTEKLENQLKKIIYDFKPNAACVELDEMSLKKITNQLTEEEIRSYFSSMPRIFKLLSSIKDKSQKASSVNRMWDTKFLYKIYKDLNFEIIPIDNDKKKMYWEIEENISFFERFRIFINVIKQLIFPVDKMEKTEGYEKRFPTLKKYLIDKRNEYMAEEIRKNAKVFKNMLILVGNNHLNGLKDLLVEEEIKIINLETLRKI